RLALDPNGLRSLFTLERERSFERILEQALHHADPLLDLHRERAPGKTRCGVGAEQIRPFERPIALGQLLEVPFRDLLEELEHLVQIASGHTEPAALPRRLRD